MRANDLFLSEFMNSVDLGLFSPSLFQYLLDFLKIEKVRRYNGQYVISTFIPPFPGKAFDRFLSTYFESGKRTSIQSADIAVTNACMFNCWHCYNAGRVLRDLSLESIQKVVWDLQRLGAIVINFTGGEPCLRHDIVDICSSLNEDSCGILATTGYGFTDDLARRLRETRIYSICVSLDSADESEHDRKRGVEGAFRIALKGIETSKKWGFYTYTCAVPLKKTLEEESFLKLIKLNESLGVDELQLVEPARAGKILSANLDFGETEFEKEFQYMRDYNHRDHGVVITSFAHMESPEFFGCGAGHSHIYVDGSGEVSPCNMIPISYGNAAKEDMSEIIAGMQSDFKHACRLCLAQTMHDFFIAHVKKAKPAGLETLPPVPFPQDEKLPRFFQILEHRNQEIAGAKEIVMGYNSASATYEDYWLSVASGPIDELFEKLEIKSGGHAIDCGCGTGYSSAKLSKRVGETGKVIGIDLSPGMIEKANNRIQNLEISNTEFKTGDVLDELKKMSPASFNVAVLTWLIGYVGCWEIFPLLKRLLKPGGILGFVAHLDRSPLIPIEVFEELSREEPQSLMKAVKLKFPKDATEIEKYLNESGLRAQWKHQDSFDFVCTTGQEVYDHVMKSGAGTTFYFALRPSERNRLATEFVRRIEKRFEREQQITITHKYVVGIGYKD